MLEVDPTVHPRVLEQVKILISKKPCEELYGLYKSIQLGLHMTHIEILPQGYLYSRDNYRGCYIGIGLKPDDGDFYRLGTIFLQNFYLGLDYETQKVAIGLNAGTTHASIQGKSTKEKKAPSGSGQSVFLVFFMIGLCVIAGACYWRGWTYEKNRKL